MGDPRGTTDLLPVFDFDDGAGEDLHPAIGLYLPKSGGHALVSEDNPLPIGAVDESGFPSSNAGKRFVATEQTPGTLITAQTSFDATTPTFMLRNVATSIRAVLRSIALSVTNGIDKPVFVSVVIDTADRLSAGGGAVTPQNMNEDSAAASGITAFLTNPTATAAGAGTRVLFTTAFFVADEGVPADLDFDDAVIIGASGSLLVYVWSDSAPEILYTFEWGEKAA